MNETEKKNMNEKLLCWKVFVYLQNNYVQWSKMCIRHT